MTEFIQGIEVLNATETMKYPNWANVLIITGIIVAIIGALVFAAHNTDDSILIPIGILTVLVGITLLFIGGIRTDNKNIHTGIYEYQVTIDDTVPATYLYENFEVISQEGKIWTIRGK